MNNSVNKKETKSFWETLPGIIAALAAVITATAGCLTVVIAWPRPNIIFPATLTPVPQESASTSGVKPIQVELTITPPPSMPPDTPTSVLPKYYLEVEQRMPVGDSLQSINQKYSLQLQTDGNLVLYENGNGVVWSTNTNGQNAAYLVLQVDGNLVLYGENGTVLWASETSGQIGEKYDFQLNDDGNLVITDNGTPIWASNTSR